jgi:DNA gyrase subunit A
VNEDDKLGWVRLTDGHAEILLVTADGMAIRFHEDKVRPMGLVAAGVGGIKLGARDLVIGMELIPRRGEILLVTSDGKAKRVPADQFPRQGRYGQGVISWKLPLTAQLVGVAAGKPNTRLTLLLDKLSPKAMRFDEAPLQTRNASGKSVIDLKAGYQVLGLSLPWAVPRAVVGEKANLDKEIEVPEETDDQVSPAVEQLSFGMDGQPSQASPRIEKPKKSQPVSVPKTKTKPVGRKTKAVPAAQAILITKSAAKKKLPTQN